MVTRASVIAFVVASGLVACQGSDPHESTNETMKPPVPEDSAAPPPPDAASSDAAPVEEPEAPDPGKVIHELGAIGAWQAVIDRAQYLARRNQSGVVFGRVGAAIAETPFTWLVDDTEGNGALGIRASLAGKAKEGDRVALRGAWELDDQRRWYWNVAGVEPLPPAPASESKDPVASVPSHAITGGPLPPGARTVSVARDNDIVYFQLTGPLPVTEGDGWPVADALGQPPVAIISMPGERPSYGGQDMRGADERWQLKRGKTYWLRIGKVRKRGDINQGGKPALINARTAPMLHQ